MKTLCLLVGLLCLLVGLTMVSMLRPVYIPSKPAIDMCDYCRDYPNDPVCHGRSAPNCCVYPRQCV